MRLPNFKNSLGLYISHCRPALLSHGQLLTHSMPRKGSWVLRSNSMSCLNISEGSQKLTSVPLFHSVFTLGILIWLNLFKGHLLKLPSFGEILCSHNLACFNCQGLLIFVLFLLMTWMSSSWRLCLGHEVYTHLWSLYMQLSESWWEDAIRNVDSRRVPVTCAGGMGFIPVSWIPL